MPTTKLVQSVGCLCLLPLLVSAAGAQCPCDCDGDGRTRTAELVSAVGAALGKVNACAAIPGCKQGEPCRVAVGSLVHCVRAALSECSPAGEPTPTPTATASPTTDSGAAAAAIALVNDIAQPVCAGVLGTPGGSFRTARSENGASLWCDSFTLHHGNIFLGHYDDSGEAVAAFGEPSPEEQIVQIGGGTARILRRRPSYSSDGSIIDWRWLRDCWVVVGDSFDDTSYELAPRPEQVVEEILRSPHLEDFLAACPSASCAPTGGPPPGRQRVFRLAGVSTVTLPDRTVEPLAGWFLLSVCYSPNTFIAGRVETLRFASRSVAIEAACPASGTLVGSTLYGGDEPLTFGALVSADGEPDRLSGRGSATVAFTPPLDLRLETGAGLQLHLVAESSIDPLIGKEPSCFDWGFY